VQVEWHKGVAALFGGADQLGKLVAMQEQFARARWIRMDMG
jgi:hypothetical protein